MSINSVSISGNLTRDPELRAFPSGTSVLRFGVAVNDRRKNSTTGEWEDKPNYIDCVVFGKRAETLETKLRKGCKVFVSGKLSYSSWETKDGQKRSKIEVVGNDVEIANATKNASEIDSNFSQKPVLENGTKTATTQGSLYADENIPF